jgi:hypothetical protein
MMRINDFLAFSNHFPTFTCRRAFGGAVRVWTLRRFWSLRRAAQLFLDAMAAPRSSVHPFSTPARPTRPDDEEEVEPQSGLGSFFSGLLSRKKSARRTAAAADDDDDASPRDEVDRKRSRRDFLFASSGGAVYFSRQRQFCEATFGFASNQVLQYNAGVFKGQRTTVVGERGGRLWVIDDEAAVATPLQGGSKAALSEQYEFSIVGSQPLEAAPAIPDLTEERLTFLTTAPDLILTVEGAAAAVHLTPAYLPGHGDAIGWSGEALTTVQGLSSTVIASVVVPLPAVAVQKNA